MRPHFICSLLAKIALAFVHCKNQLCLVTSIKTDLVVVAQLAKNQLGFCVLQKSTHFLCFVKIDSILSS